MIKFCKSQEGQQQFADFLKIGVLKNFANLIGKHLHWSHYLIKL